MNCTAKCLKKTVNDDVPTEAADLSKLEKEKLHSFD